MLELTEIGELNCILDEEDRNIVAHQIPVSLVGIELDGEASYISNGVRTPFTPLDGGETDKNRCISGCIV